MWKDEDEAQLSTKEVTSSMSILRKKKTVSFKKKSDYDDLGNDESQKKLSFENAVFNDNDVCNATEEETDVNAVTVKSAAEMSFEKILQEDEEIAQLVSEEGKVVAMKWYKEILENQQQSQSQAQTQQQTYQEEDTDDDDASLLASSPPPSRLDSLKQQIRQRRELERQSYAKIIHENEVIGEIYVGRHIFRVAFRVMGDGESRLTLRLLDNVTPTDPELPDTTYLFDPRFECQFVAVEFNFTMKEMMAQGMLRLKLRVASCERLLFPLLRSTNVYLIWLDKEVYVQVDMDANDESCVRFQSALWLRIEEQQTKNDDTDTVTTVDMNSLSDSMLDLSLMSTNVEVENAEKPSAITRDNFFERRTSQSLTTINETTVETLGVVNGVDKVVNEVAKNMDQWMKATNLQLTRLVENQSVQFDATEMLLKEQLTRRRNPPSGRSSVPLHNGTNDRSARRSAGKPSSAIRGSGSTATSTIAAKKPPLRNATNDRSVGKPASSSLRRRSSTTTAKAPRVYDSRKPARKKFEPSGPSGSRKMPWEQMR